MREEERQQPVQRDTERGAEAQPEKRHEKRTERTESGASFEIQRSGHDGDQIQTQKLSVFVPVFYDEFNIQSLLSFHK